MSSTRSRSGGTRSGTTFSRKYRSSRKRPAAISDCRSLLVAARTRTSTRSVVPPTGSNACSCRTRSTFACVRSDMSAISSRNSVPPSASANRPGLLSAAPVNAPLTWPNSSLSMSSSGMAAQFISTNGSEHRVDCAWIARATSSFPVPFSPKIRTRPLVGAVASICWRRSRIGRLSPIRVSFSCSCSRSCWIRWSFFLSATALRSVRAIFSRESGFSTKSNAPRRPARWASGTSA